jgi:hypothetical protein
MITTTLNKILKCDPCGQEPGSDDGWQKLLAYLGKTGPDDEPLSLITILESNGLVDALWALRAVNGYDRETRLFACWCACQALHTYEHNYPGDCRLRKAVETSALYAEGMASVEELVSARTAARATARVSARTAARATARVSAWAAAWAAAGAAAWAAAWAAQKTEFRRMCEEGHEYMRMEI